MTESRSIFYNGKNTTYLAHTHYNGRLQGGWGLNRRLPPPPPPKKIMLFIMLKCINIQIYKITVIIPAHYIYPPIAMNMC